MKMRVAIGVALLGLAASGCTSSAILYEGPDRPGGEEVEGPAPPGDYKFGGSNERVTDTNGDKRADRIEYLEPDGSVKGVAEDTNYDGKIDVYRKMSGGKVVEEVRDRNYDGVLDERSRDTNGDGTLDVTEPFEPKSPALK